MLSTLPDTPCASIQSPMRNGQEQQDQHTTGEVAEAALQGQWPMARPAAPMAATKDAVETPTMDATLTSSSTLEQDVAQAADEAGQGAITCARPSGVAGAGSGG